MQRRKPSWKKWPRFDEAEEPSNSQKLWGDVRLGRLPAVVQHDRPPPLAAGSSCEPGRSATGNSDVPSVSVDLADAERYLADAERYKAKCLDAFQYFQARCQHHMHRVSSSTGKRTIPNACRPAGNKKRLECKHGAPWVERLNVKKPLLLCKKIAKKRMLRCSGNRNVLGTVLGLRNDEWLNGTAHALCIAFAGSNSDVSPSDHIPITEFTHESDICTGQCVKKTNVRRMIRIAQRAQAMTNGYFGGYIGKAQPAGHMEIKKCIDKMYTLRGRLADGNKSLRQQQRAVSGRMVTDLEMNGVFRGAVEQFNLATNLRRNDALFPGCVRTFSTRFINTQTFFYRLRTVMEGGVWMHYTVYVLTPWFCRHYLHR